MNLRDYTGETCDERQGGKMMSKIKDWILEQQEIDSQDDPDMDEGSDLESLGETSASTPKRPSGDSAAEEQAKPK